VHIRGASSGKPLKNKFVCEPAPLLVLRLHLGDLPIYGLVLPWSVDQPAQLGLQPP
jgi:hypothetical protein